MALPLLCSGATSLTLVSDMNALRILPVCFALLLAGAAARPAAAQLGIAAGLNYADFNDIDLGSRSASVDNASGYHLGVFLDLPFGAVAVRPGVFFRNVQDITYDVLDRNVDLNLIDVPIDLRLRLPAPLVAPYLTAGPVITYASSSDEAFNDSVRDLSLSANVGAGVELSVPLLGLKLFPEVRYAFGVSNLVDDFEFLGASMRTDGESQRLNSFMLRLGVGF